MKEQTRNTEVQINEEELGKLPEKEFRIMIIKMIKNLENKMEKMQKSMNKDLEELKNKHTEKTAQLLKLKIIQKESIAEYLKQKNEEEIGRLPEKEFRIMIVKMTKNLENKIEKCKNQLTKTQKN